MISLKKRDRNRNKSKIDKAYLRVSVRRVNLPRYHPQVYCSSSFLYLSAKTNPLSTMNNTSNTTEDIIDTMVNVTLTEPQRYKVYIVKYSFASSPPEGDSAIFVKTNEEDGNIHFIASKDAGAHMYYDRVSVRANEVTERGDSLMLIGTTLTKNYPGSWDKALRVVEENQQYATPVASMPLPGSSQARMRRLRISSWTQECARPALEKAGLLEKLR